MSKMIGNVDLEEFKRGKIAVSCLTEEDDSDFLQGIVFHGVKWVDGSPITSSPWRGYSYGKCCYAYWGDEGLVTCTNEDTEERKVIKYEKERKGMKFEDFIKENWIVLFRNGDSGIVGKDTLIYRSDGRWVCKSEYDNDLRLHPFVQKKYDIMKVWSTDGGEMTLVWERKEPTELELLESQLKELQDKIAELKKGGK